MRQSKSLSFFLLGLFTGSAVVLMCWSCVKYRNKLGCIKPHKQDPNKLFRNIDSTLTKLEREKL